MTGENALEELENEPETPVIEEAEKGEETEAKEEKPKENRYSKRVKDLNTKWRESERKADDLEKRLNDRDEASKLKKEPDPDDYDEGVVPDADKKKWSDQIREEIRQEERTKIKQEMAQKKQQAKYDEGKDAYIKARPAYLEADPKHGSYEREIDEAVDQWQAPEIQNIIIESKELGPEIVKHFGKNPDDLLDIASSSPAKRFFKMGQLVTKLQAKAVKKTSSAPAPTRSEKGSAKKVSVSNDAPYDSKKETFQEFSRRKNGL